MTLPVSLLVLLVSLWNICAAQEKDKVTPVDAYVAASQKTTLQLFHPLSIPAGFLLGDLQMTTDPVVIVISSYYNTDGRKLIIMQSSPDGLACPDCATIDIDGIASPYEIIKQSNGMTLTNITVTLGKTAVVVGLVRKTGGNLADTLLTLRPVAESLQKVETKASSKLSTNAAEGLKESARQATFPVYAPRYLPTYFYLKTVAYSPPDLVSLGATGSSEQIVITYAAGEKEIHIAIGQAGAFDLQSGGSKQIKTLAWPTAISTHNGQSSIVIDLGKSMALINGNVSTSTLIAVAKSLQVLD